jgi:hypothetical protein
MKHLALGAFALALGLMPAMAAQDADTASSLTWHLFAAAKNMTPRVQVAECRTVTVCKDGQLQCDSHGNNCHQICWEETRCN